MFDRADLIYRYDGTLEGLLCCVFETHSARRAPMDIWETDEPRVSLVPEFAVPPDRGKAARVWRRLRELSPDAAHWTEVAFLAGEEDKAMALHDFLCAAFRRGRAVTSLLGDPVVARAFQLQRRVQGEAHLLKEFVRFEEHQGVLAAQIEPKAFVLPLMAPHFAGRFPGEAFLIHDITHGAVLLHQNGRMEIQPLEDLVLDSPTPAEARYQDLWKRYYDTIGIKERYNPKCRMGHCPKRFWNHMLEMSGSRVAPGRVAPTGGRVAGTVEKPALQPRAPAPCGGEEFGRVAPTGGRVAGVVGKPALQPRAPAPCGDEGGGRVAPTGGRVAGVAGKPALQPRVPAP